MKIAVFLDEQGQVAPLTTPGVVTLFTQVDERWQPCRKIPFTLAADMPLREIRQHTWSMLSLLAGCQHFVAGGIHGALRAWLDGMGVTMWQCAGRPETFLNAIAQQARPEPAPAALLPDTFIRPGAQEGEFRVDLIAALHCGGAHTSKRLLMPLFERQPFTRLDIICDHIPKWFDSLGEYQLCASSTALPDGSLQVVVTPQVSKIVP